MISQRYVADARSGEKLYIFDTDQMTYIAEQTAHHTPHDSFDGYCVCQHLIMRAIRRYGMNSTEQKVLEDIATFYQEKMTADFMTEEKTSLRLITVLDMRRHGYNLCKDFLRD